MNDRLVFLIFLFAGFTDWNKIVAQELPSEAVGPAVGVSIYSSICLMLSCALLWATIAHREWKSCESVLRQSSARRANSLLKDVAFFAFFTSLSTIASMVSIYCGSEISTAVFRMPRRLARTFD